MLTHIASPPSGKSTPTVAILQRRQDVDHNNLIVLIAAKRRINVGQLEGGENDCLAVASSARGLTLLEKGLLPDFG